MQNMFILNSFLQERSAQTDENLKQLTLELRDMKHNITPESDTLSIEVECLYVVTCLTIQEY